MVKMRPPTVMVPVRAGPVLAATEKLTVPLPVPLAPPVIVIQLSLRTACQSHAAVVVRLKLPVPPAVPKFWLVDERL